MTQRLPPGTALPWSPMTDDEWEALAPFVTHRLGRPPRDPRRTWDAIFWVACSTAPWAALPPELGRADTAHSALIHAARTGVLDRLLIAAAGHPLMPDGVVPLRARICRAFRRASRQLRPESLALARDAGLDDALYCDPAALPAPEPLHPAPVGRPPHAAGRHRLPYIPRRLLRGLPPPRGVARPVVTPPPPAGPEPRRGSQAHPRRHARASRARGAS